MSFDRVSGVVIPFPRPFRGPVSVCVVPPTRWSRVVALGAGRAPATTAPGGWRLMAGDVAALGLLGVVAALQAEVLAGAFGVFGQ